MWPHGSLVIIIAFNLLHNVRNNESIIQHKIAGIIILYEDFFKYNFRLNKMVQLNKSMTMLKISFLVL